MGRRVLKHSFFLLNVDYVKLGDKWDYKNVISPYYRIYYIDDGNGYISTEAESLALEPGYMYIVPSFTICNLKCPDYLCQYFIHFFEDSYEGVSMFQNNRKIFKIPANPVDIENFKRILAINPYRKIYRSDNPTVYEKNIYYKEYEELNEKQDAGTFLETQGILLQLLSRFINSKFFFQKDTSFIPSKVLELLGYIELNLGKKLTVAQLARRVNQHPDYFSRLFVRLTGERPLSYIHIKRVERAQYFITTSNHSILEIAEITGFSSLPHFSKIFKQITNLTPLQYRNQNHPLNML